MADLDGWVTRFTKGEARALARGLTWLEAGDPRGTALLARVRPQRSVTRVLGLTGAPGVGKSTLADHLVEAWRTRGWRVGVLAIDPSSPISGGSLLGDRVRLTRWAGDDGVFVRSMASRGRTGGLAPTAFDALALMTAFGFDVLLLETVGVGQAEVDVVAVADTTVVALAPGTGDDVQAAKAGLMEIADVFALTQSDRPGAARLAANVRESLDLRSAAGGGASAATPEDASWRPPVVELAVGVGVTERPQGFAADGGMGALLAALDAHADHLAAAGAARGRDAARLRTEAAWRAQAALRVALQDLWNADGAAVGGSDRSATAMAVEALRRAAWRLANRRELEVHPHGHGVAHEPSDDADC